MTMTWPSTLPQAFLAGKVTELPQNPILETTNDQGGPKFRQQYTAINTLFQGEMIMTREQVVTFKAFYAAVGSQQWNWVDQNTQLPCLYCFTSAAPQYQNLVPGVYDVKLTVMQLAQ